MNLVYLAREPKPFLLVDSFKKVLRSGLLFVLLGTNLPTLS